MSIKPRVMLCASSYPPDIRGGGEISTALIAKGLVAMGVDLRVLTFTSETTRTDVIDGVVVERLRCPNNYWSMDSATQSLPNKLMWHMSQAIRFRPPRTIRQAIDTFKPNIIHTSTIEDFGPGIWRWAKSHGYYCVHTLRSYNLIHHYGTLYNPQTDSQRGADILSHPKKFYSQSLSGVIGISQYILQRHQQDGYFREAKHAVIPNPSDEPIAEYPNRNLGAIKLGILGRVVPEKGIAQFISALIDSGATQSWELEIAGNGPETYLSHLRDLSKGYPIQLVGWKNSREFLSSLDILVVPSRWQEPFGRIVVEAFSIGVPVLCLRRGGLPELVRQGCNGWVTDEWTSNVIRQAIEQCRHVDHRAINNDAKLYTVESVANRHLEFYRSLFESS